MSLRDVNMSINDVNISFQYLMSIFSIIIKAQSVLQKSVRLWITRDTNTITDWVVLISPLRQV